MKDEYCPFQMMMGAYNLQSPKTGTGSHHCTSSNNRETMTFVLTWGGKKYLCFKSLSKKIFLPFREAKRKEIQKPPQPKTVENTVWYAWSTGKTLLPNIIFGNIWRGGSISVHLYFSYNKKIYIFVACIYCHFMTTGSVCGPQFIKGKLHETWAYMTILIIIMIFL